MFLVKIMAWMFQGQRLNKQKPVVRSNIMKNCTPYISVIGFVSHEFPTSAECMAGLKDLSVAKGNEHMELIINTGEAIISSLKWKLKMMFWWQFTACLICSYRCKHILVIDLLWRLQVFGLTVGSVRWTTVSLLP